MAANPLISQADANKVSGIRDWAHFFWYLFTERDTRKLFDAISSHYDAHAGGRHAYLKSWQFLGEYSEAKGLGTLLEAGCGTGLYSEGLEGLATLHGVDLSSGQLRMAKRKTLDMLLAQGDAGALPYANASFDALTSFRVLIYFPGRETDFFREAYRVLKPGGLLFAEPIIRVDESAPLGQKIAYRAGWSVAGAVARLAQVEFDVPKETGYIVDALRETGFEVGIETRSGAWDGHGLTWDFIVARKR